MSLAPWYFLTLWLAPVRTEPVLVPFATASACYQYQTGRLEAWDGYIQRNRRLWAARGPNHGFANWVEPSRSCPDAIVVEDRLSFRLRAGPIVVYGECLRGAELSPESLKSLSTSP